MIVTLALRVLQLLFAAIVLALSVILIKDYGPGTSWSLISYGAFCGGAAIVIAAIGVVACFLEALQGIIMLALDGLASFFLLAGGIAYAATIKVGSCSNIDYLSNHNNPFVPGPGKTYPSAQAAFDDVKARCQETQASTAFIWFTTACFIGTTVIHFLGSKRGGGAASFL
ncbi:hypothetical protein MFRU_003g03220 [Monilinia fructicola]|uniref:MARVEL domain-containing protein n=1 Tax=Monilinia fructicola TaxID=38448 RepID=A0A5M9JUV1_MONFR|nr:hypothetical protein EYC84_003077 [Monilinia fructicola]KAG4034353.1 hypothetical protein MFRU_003g03220 [Monilinia fructicola]